METKIGATSPVYRTVLYDGLGQVIAWHNRTTYTNLFLPLGGQTFATYEASQTFFLHGNRLGSTTFVTDQAGTVTQKSVFYPFGQLAAMSGTMRDERFASLERRDAETSLDPTLFRMYHSRLYRWLSPDPLAGDISDPQSLNRYGYVVNNPLNFVDPFGLDGESLAELPPPPPFAACHLQLWPGCVVIGSETVDLPPVGSSGSGSDPLGRMMHELSYYGGTPRRQGAPKRKEYFAELLDTTCRTPGCMGALKIAGNFAAGAADVLTGPVAVVAEALGADTSYPEDSVVDTESGAYAAGGVGGVVLGTAMGAEATAAATAWFVPASRSMKLFTTSVLNNNRYVRLGWNRHRGTHVFRLSVGKWKSPWNHLDFFNSPW